MPLNTKFNLSATDTPNGAKGSIAATFVPTEIANAQIAGTGPGVPDVNGNIPFGTMVEGHIVVLNSSGTLDLLTSGDLSAVFSVIPWVVWAGDDERSSIASGKVAVIHGGCRFDTEKYDTAQTYVKGNPLIAVAGLLSPKVLADNKQIVAYVGERGAVNGVLDVIMPQGIGGRY